ncbi:MAG TPA: hypothetical protein VMV83_01300 [Rectinemataceae bacterium]|nr:hypothetical protein [Rectinemataceae bacterium]
MELALIIVGGLVLMTGIAGIFDYLGKRKASLNTAALERIEALEREIAILKSASADDEGRIGKLESDIGFVSRLIEDGKR